MADLTTGLANPSGSLPPDFLDPTAASAFRLKPTGPRAAASPASTPPGVTPVQPVAAPAVAPAADPAPPAPGAGTDPAPAAGDVGVTGQDGRSHRLTQAQATQYGQISDFRARQQFLATMPLDGGAAPGGGISPSPGQPPAAPQAPLPATESPYYLGQAVQHIIRAEAGAPFRHVGSMQDYDPATTPTLPGHYGFPAWEGKGNSHATGLGQFQPGTWKGAVEGWMAKNPGQPAPDFRNPQDQIKVTTYWADRRYRELTGGRDLAADTKAGTVQWGKLGPEWQAFQTGSGSSTGPASGADLTAGGTEAYRGYVASFDKRIADAQKIADRIEKEIDKVDPHSEERHQLMRRRQDQLDRLEQMYLDKAQHPPTETPADMIGNFGSLASAISIFAGMFARRPIVASLNASASAMEAINTRDHEAFTQAYKTWDDQTGMLSKAMEMEHRAYQDVVEDENLSMRQKADKLRELGQLYQNQKILGDLEAGRWEAVIKLPMDLEKQRGELQHQRNQAQEWQRKNQSYIERDAAVAAADQAYEAANPGATPEDKARAHHENFIRAETQRTTSEKPLASRSNEASIYQAERERRVALADAKFAADHPEATQDEKDDAHDEAMRQAFDEVRRPTKAPTPPAEGTVNDMMAKWHKGFVETVGREPTFDETKAQRDRATTKPKTATPARFGTVDGMMEQWRKGFVETVGREPTFAETKAQHDRATAKEKAPSAEERRVTDRVQADAIRQGKTPQQAAAEAQDPVKRDNARSQITREKSVQNQAIDDLIEAQAKTKGFDPEAMKRDPEARVVARKELERMRHHVNPEEAATDDEIGAQAAQEARESGGSYEDILDRMKNDPETRRAARLKVLRERGAARSGQEDLSEGALDNMAEQYIRGNTAVLTALPRAGPARIRLENKIADKTRGMDDAAGKLIRNQLAMDSARVAARTAGRVTMLTENYVKEAITQGQQVIETSKLFPRGEFPPVNKVLASYQENIGDPNIVAFGAALSAFINTYGKLSNPTGVGVHDADKERIAHVLGRALSPEQIEAAVNQIIIEGKLISNAAREAQEEVIRDMMPTGLDRQPVPPAHTLGGTPQQTGAAPATPPWAKGSSTGPNNEKIYTDGTGWFHSDHTPVQ
jgi:hypothetical protein